MKAELNAPDPRTHLLMDLLIFALRESGPGTIMFINLGAIIIASR